MIEEVKKLAEGAGDALGTVSKVYEDGLQPTVKEVGTFVSRIPRAINAAFSGLDQWILNKEYNVEETKKLLEKKLENTNPEKIVAPEAYVAVPAIQAISYSMNSNELRNMYANLLANSMNQDTKDLVHPSFVEIIKQMSPSDAILFKIIYDSPLKPVIDLSINYESGGNNDYIYNLTWINSYSSSTIRICIDNLIRLGLIEIPFGKNYTSDSIYESVRNNSHYIDSHLILSQKNIGTINEDKKVITCTELASSFYNICIKDI